MVRRQACSWWVRLLRCVRGQLLVPQDSGKQRGGTRRWVWLPLDNEQVPRLRILARVASRLLLPALLSLWGTLRSMLLSCTCAGPGLQSFLPMQVPS